MSAGALSCSLPDGRQVSIAAEASSLLSCGLVVMDPVVIDQNTGPAEDCAAMAPGLQAQYDGLLPSEIEGLTEARKLYKGFGMDPSRHRPSSEALLRRLLKGQDLYRINSAVDGCNLASVSMLLPIGMYDLDLVQGDVQLKAGQEGDEYPGIRKGPVHLAGRLGLFDRQGPFGSPTSDSARTSVSESTQKIMAVIMATAEYPAQAMAANLELISDIFSRHVQGVTTFKHVLSRGAV